MEARCMLHLMAPFNVVASTRYVHASGTSYLISCVVIALFVMLGISCTVLLTRAAFRRGSGKQ